MPLTGAEPPSTPVIIPTIFRQKGSTGVHTHILQVLGYLESQGTYAVVVTPFTWQRYLSYLVFSPRLVLKYCSPAAGVVWYRYWHEVFLALALRRLLTTVDECVIYAQGPLEAQAALRARRGPQQRVVMAVHFRVSQADEHAEPGREIKRNGAVFRAIRKLEREVILRVDGLVYVSKWARDSLLSWLPDAASLPSAVIGNAVTPLAVEERLELLADIVTIGRLDLPKNHRFLLDILSEAKCLGRIIKLDIYGDGPLRRDLARQVKKLGLDGQVRILGYCTNVRQVLPAYRAYVHSSYAETSSLAIIEAMAARLPVVAANIGPIPELYDDGVEGRFWPLDDPARAAAILLELLDSEEALSAAAAAAYDRFQREFDIASVGARLEGFLMGKIEE